MEFNNNNYYFPEEISINIISRLPTLSVLRCSLVCKSWRDLIICKIIWNNLEFARMHLLRGGLESHHDDHGASSAYYDGYTCKIQVLGGQLCAFHLKESLTVSMWFFKNKKEEKKNGNYKDGNGRPEYQSWSWIKEFDIERDLTVGGSLTPFILTEHGDVLYYGWVSLFCFDLKTATSKELVGMVKCLPSDFYHLAAIPHLNSFISIKALGEEDTKIIIESAN